LSSEKNNRRCFAEEYNRDIGRMLENIVYLALIRRGFTVKIGKVGEKEVGFVATRGCGLCFLLP